MDILDDILETLKFKGNLYFQTEFSGSWGIEVPSFEQAIRFHLVLQGQCHVRLSADTGQQLNPGDLIFITAGANHHICDSPNHSTLPLQTILHDTGYQGEGVLVYKPQPSENTTKLLCGHLNFREGAYHPVLQALPDTMLGSKRFSPESRRPQCGVPNRLITVKNVTLVRRRIEQIGK